MNIKNQILDAIDDIDIITAECEYNTICEMYNSYDKASLILEYYEGDNVDAFNVFDDTDNFYQESGVYDKMKKSGAKYNTFMKIITFIPRLVKALLQTIKEKFKKIKPSKELQKAPKEVKEKLTTVFDKKKDKKKRIATVASLILGAGAVGVATGVGVHKLRKHSVNAELVEEEDDQEPTPEVEKIAEQIADNIDSNIDDINKRYKNLVNKLYSHDSMQLPPANSQSVDVKFNDEKDDIDFLYDTSKVGHISYVNLRLSLFAAQAIMKTLNLYAATSDDEKSINKINELVDERLEKFKTEKKRNSQGNTRAYLDKGDVSWFIGNIETLIKDNNAYVDEFSSRSEEVKKRCMTQTVQNAIKTLNDESKFYHDIFYEFLSLYGEMVKLIDNTYSSLKVKVSDEYKFDENAEKLSKINTDISLS